MYPKGDMNVCVNSVAVLPIVRQKCEPQGSRETDRESPESPVTLADTFLQFNSIYLSHIRNIYSKAVSSFRF